MGGRGREGRGRHPASASGEGRRLRCLLSELVRFLQKSHVMTFPFASRQVLNMAPLKKIRVINQLLEDND